MECEEESWEQTMDRLEREAWPTGVNSVACQKCKSVIKQYPNSDAIKDSVFYLGLCDDCAGRNKPKT